MNGLHKKIVYHQHQNLSHLQRHHKQQIETVVNELKAILEPRENYGTGARTTGDQPLVLSELSSLGWSLRKTEREPGANCALVPSRSHCWQPPWDFNFTRLVSVWIEAKTKKWATLVRKLAFFLAERNQQHWTIKFESVTPLTSEAWHTYPYYIDWTSRLSQNQRPNCQSNQANSADDSALTKLEAEEATLNRIFRMPSSTKWWSIWPRQAARGMIHCNPISSNQTTLATV